MGNLFLRKYSFGYIFNSKIESIDAHVKYRCKLLKGISNPESFQFIKGFWKAKDENIHIYHYFLIKFLNL